MGTTQTTLTFEEFERMPDRPGKQELLRGELIEFPPAELRHSRTALRIYRLMDAALIEAHARGEALDLGEACHEMGYKLAGHSWLVPDASVTHAGQVEGEYFEGAPVIAIEVISPVNTAKQIEIKTGLYFEFGACEVWRVHQKPRKIVVHARSSAQPVTHYDFVTTPLIPGFSMSIDDILGPAR